MRSNRCNYLQYLKIYLFKTGEKFCLESLNSSCEQPHSVDANLESTFAIISMQLSSYKTLLDELTVFDELPTLLTLFILDDMDERDDCAAGLFFICKIDFNGLIKCSITSSLQKHISHVSSAAHKSCSKSNAYLAGEYSFGVLNEAVS